jgi:hypothetical protein
MSRLLAVLIVLGALTGAGLVGAEPDVREEFAARLEKVDGKDADALLRLALWARHAGLVPEAKEMFVRVLHVEPDHRRARKALGYELIGGLWLRGDAAKRAKGFVRRDGRWILAEELEAGEAKRQAQEETATKAIRALCSDDERVRGLARKSLAALPAERVVRPALITLETGKQPSRLWAVEFLAGRATDETLVALIRSSIMDTSPEVRALATQAVTEAGHEDAVYPYVRAVESGYAPVRMNAAKALGEIRDVRGIEVVIRRLKGIAGGSPRANIYAGRQMSYVRDFDVEIAQAAQIGDPIIGTLQEGVVLDVRVLSLEWDTTTIERRVLYRTLARITGQNLGEDTAAWVSWWNENRDRVLADASAGREPVRR